MKSAEHRRKISEAMRGRKCPPGCTCHKHRNGWKKCPPGCTCDRHIGHQWTEEQKKKWEIPCLPGCTCKRHEYHGPSPTLTHGVCSRLNPLFGTPAQISFHAMHNRCRPNGSYGKRGIHVCTEWPFTIEGLHVFVAHIGQPPDDMKKPTVHRIEGGTTDYEPGNVEWAPAHHHPPDRPRSERRRP